MLSDEKIVLLVFEHNTMWWKRICSIYIRLMISGWCNGPPVRLRISCKASECKNTQVHIHWQLEDEDIEYHETEA